MAKTETDTRRFYCSEHNEEVMPVMPFRTLWQCPAGQGHWVQVYRDCERR